MNAYIKIEIWNEKDLIDRTLCSDRICLQTSSLASSCIWISELRPTKYHLPPSNFSSSLFTHNWWSFENLLRCMCPAIWKNNNELRFSARILCPPNCYFKLQVFQQINPIFLGDQGFSQPVPESAVQHYFACEKLSIATQ